MQPQRENEALEVNSTVQAQRLDSLSRAQVLPDTRALHAALEAAIYLQIRPLIDAATAALRRNLGPATACAELLTCLGGEGKRSRGG